MASTNQSPFYQRAEEDFLNAKTDEERIACLEIMMKECPKHKSSENMRKNLTNRYKKLKEGLEKQKKSGKGGQIGIKKADMQCVLAGFPNSGKSTLFNLLTQNNPHSKTSPNPFTTKNPILGTFKHDDAPIQIIDQPSFPNHDKSLTNSTDTLLLVVDNLEQINKADEYIWKSRAKLIVIFNKIDLLSEQEIRKLEATLKSKYKKFDFILFSSFTSTKPEIEHLKKKIFDTFPTIRVYTKEPKKDFNEALAEPMILKENSTLKEAANHIRKGFAKTIKKARIWGPSSKFGGQVVGLEHVLKDRDVIEFQTI